MSEIPCGPWHSVLILALRSSIKTPINLRLSSQGDLSSVGFFWDIVFLAPAVPVDFSRGPGGICTGVSGINCMHDSCGVGSDRKR